MRSSGSMRLIARTVVGSVFLLVSSFYVAAQSAAQQAGPAAGSAIGIPVGSGAEVSFQFERIGLPVPQFTIQVREDGTGRYQAEQAERPATGGSMRGEAAQHIDRTMVLSPGMVTKIFKAAHELNDFNMTCVSKLKNIADTGKKTLSYTGADGQGSCVYHYSDNKSVMMLSDTFIGIAYTMDAGRRLEFLHRYDRLGLDEEMIQLSQEVEAGRALELGTISQTLTALVNDSAVLERVRARATKMLEQSK
jgi:hypothetical protein